MTTPSVVPTDLASAPATPEVGAGGVNVETGVSPASEATSSVSAPGGSIRRKPVPTPRSTLRKPIGAQPSPHLEDDAPARTPQLRRQRTSSSDSTSPDDSGCPKDEDIEDDLAATATVAGAGAAGADDILSALEKIPGVGSLRSEQSSIGSSLPSLSLDKLKREESSHSLGSHSCSGQFSMRGSDADPTKDAPRRDCSLARPSGRRPIGHNSSAAVSPLPIAASLPTKSATLFLNRKSPSSRLAFSPTKANGDQQSKDESMSKTLVDTSRREDMLVTEGSGKRIQTRPLPKLPESSIEDSSSNMEEISVVQSPLEEEEEGLYSALLSPDHYTAVEEGRLSNRLSVTTSTSTSPSSSSAANMQSPTLSSKQTGYLTLTGTMRKSQRGTTKSKSSTSHLITKEDASASTSNSVAVVDIETSLTQQQLSQIERRVYDKHHDRCYCGLRRGLHVFLLSLFAMPFYCCYSTLYAFYFGTLMWYNVFLYYNEERGCCSKLLSPLVLLVYPLWILPVVLGIGLAGALAQVSWYWDTWMHNVRAPDHGFFDWFCKWLDVPPECSPYQVVIVSSTSAPDYQPPANGATML